jgi:hypothetical protein
MNTRALLYSGLIAGIAMALLAEVPGLSFINCVCCVWLWGGGILAVYIYRRFAREQPRLSILQGMGVGATAGLIGAFIGAVLNVLFSPVHALILKGLVSAADPETSRILTSIPMLNTPTFLLSLVENLATYLIFGAIGGLIGVALIWKTPKVTTPSPSESAQPPSV